MHVVLYRDFDKKKFWLELPFHEELKFAIDDFKTNWKKYRKYFKI
jgi:hypothetical protein